MCWGETAGQCMAHKCEGSRHAAVHVSTASWGEGCIVQHCSLLGSTCHMAHCRRSHTHSHMTLSTPLPTQSSHTPSPTPAKLSSAGKPNSDMVGPPSEEREGTGSGSELRCCRGAGAGTGGCQCTLKVWGYRGKEGLMRAWRCGGEGGWAEGWGRGAGNSRLWGERVQGLRSGMARGRAGIREVVESSKAAKGEAVKETG